MYPWSKIELKTASRVANGIDSICNDCSPVLQMKIRVNCTRSDMCSDFFVTKLQAHFLEATQLTAFAEAEGGIQLRN
jgi:hypothetical protein